MKPIMGMDFQNTNLIPRLLSSIYDLIEMQWKVKKFLKSHIIIVGFCERLLVLERLPSILGLWGISKAEHVAWIIEM